MSAAFSRELVIEWGDCDPAGIVFYPRYFEMFNTSTSRLMEHVTGLAEAEIMRSYGIIGWPMVDTGAKFLVPSTFGDKVEIETSITRVGRSSFNIAHRLLKGQDLRIEAYEARVWAVADPLKPGAIRSMALPENLAEKLRA